MNVTEARKVLVEYGLNPIIVSELPEEDVFVALHNLLTSEAIYKSHFSAIVLGAFPYLIIPKGMSTIPVYPGITIMRYRDNVYHVKDSYGNTTYRSGTFPDIYRALQFAKRLIASAGTLEPLT